MLAVHSFDVFDTVLTRRVGEPERVIDVLAARLSAEGRLPVPSDVFAAARKRQERRLAQLTGRHLPLRSIYDEVARVLSLDPGLADAWAEAEERLDRTLTVPVPGASEMLGASRSAGHRVVFVSDTPYSEPFLRELLVVHGLLEEGDLVFSSADRGVTKSRGGLFTAVAAMLDHEGEFVHHGDNPMGDVASARLEGWRSRRITQGRLTRYEQLLEAWSSDSGLLASWLAGAARLARLEARHRGVVVPVADVAAGVMAPLLLGYVLWVLGQARRRGIRRLYFVARDGEVMLEVARLLAPRVAPDLELRYLHGSRQPWVLGACAHSDLMLAHWTSPRPDFTARTTLDRVGLTPEQVYDLVGQECVRPDRADVPLSATDRSELAALLRREPLVSLVRAAADDAAERCTTYLRQEGLLDGTSSALVDAGWSGRAAAGLDQLLLVAGGSRVPHMVMGLLGLAAEAGADGEVELIPWLFDRRTQPESTSGVHAPNVAIEMFCAGTTGRTIGYTSGADGRMRPVLDQQRNDAALDWGLLDARRTMLRAVELVAPQLGPDSVHTDLTGATWDVLKAFWTHPSRDEVEVWGSFPGEEEIWPAFMPLAQRITGRSVAGRVRRGEVSLRPNNTWRAGSAVVSRQPWRALLRGLEWWHEHGARVRRLPRRLRLEVALRRSR